MAQAGYTPIQLYYSTTAAAVPTAGNLNSGELAINITDGKLYYKNNSGTVTLLSASGGGPAGGSNTQVQFNSSGVLAGSANMTFDGTTLTANALTVTNAVTLSGGTANGVAYLNGSKVVTSGSALTFNGSTLGVNFTSSSNYKFYVSRGGTAGELAAFTDGTAQTLTIDTAASSILINSANGGALAFGVTTEQMRLTSTGLGIGTSSPAYKLDVVGATGTTTSGIYETSASGSSIAISRLRTTGTGRGYWDIRTGNTASGLTGALDFFDNIAGASRLTLDSSGNLGLGVTPSAWSSIFKVMQVGAGASYIGGRTDSVAGRQIWLGTNSYYDGTNWLYSVSQPAAQYYQNDGAHIWNRAASGTAGNAITFTQALTLDSGGALLIGDTSAPTNGLTSAALSTKGQGTGGSRRSTASAMGITSSLAQNATANTYSFGGYGGYGLFVAEGGDPNAAWRAAAIVWSTGAALTILNLGSSNITVGSSGTTVTVQNTSASAQTIAWSMLVLG